MNDIVPVIWVTNKPDIIARGYWDQGFLEGLLDGSVWRVPGMPQFQHFVTDGEDGWPTDLELAANFGAIVIVPARHHADQIEWLNTKLALFPSVIVILTGDEEHVFPVVELNHPRMEVWVMTPDPAKHRAFKRRFGTMWPPFTPRYLSSDKARALAWERGLDVYFSGQNTHARRHQCVGGLHAAITARGSGHGWIVNPTPGFTQGDSNQTYTELLAAAKIAPCPSGPVSVDTFRVWEALEAGCIPLADRRTPDDDGSQFWPLVLGEEPPFPVIQDWGTIGTEIDALLAEWPANANRIFAWWQGHRRKMAYDLAEDIDQVLGVPYRKAERADLVTVLIPTSPVTRNRSAVPTEAMSHIVETVDSVRERLGDAEIIIMIDGVRPEQEHLRGWYEEYQRNLLWKCLHEWHNVLPVRFDTFHHQAAMTRAALDHVQTPTIMFVEHDTPLVGDIEFDPCIDAILTGNANVIRFHHEASVLEPHRHLMLDEVPQNVNGAPLLRTAQWSQRPHLASTEFYRSMLHEYFGSEARTMIEDLIHGVVVNYWREGGITGWRRFKLWMYAPDGDMKRSTHTDARAGVPKYPMTFAYDGTTPQFAPHPGLRAED